MKKIFFYIIIIMIIVFAIPSILTTKFTFVETISDMENNQKDIEEVKKYTEYNYKNYGTINMVDSKNNETSKMSLDEYLLRSSFSRNAS